MSQVRQIAESADGETLVLSVRGEVDLATSPALKSELGQHALKPFTTIVLDMTELEFIDSSGIRVLFEFAALLRHHGQTLRIVLPEEAQPWPALRISGIERIAEVSHRFEGLNGKATNGESG